MNKDFEIFLNNLPWMLIRYLVIFMCDETTVQISDTYSNL